MILIAYILAVILKMINKNNKFQHEVRVFAKVNEMKVEDVIKLKYFQLFTDKMVKSEDNPGLLFEILNP